MDKKFGEKLILYRSPKNKKTNYPLKIAQQLVRVKILLSSQSLSAALAEPSQLCFALLARRKNESLFEFK